MNWNQMMQFGFGILKLNPKDFWGLSVPELEAAIEAYYPAKTSPLTRGDFEHLQTMFPDEPQNIKE